MEGGVKGCFRGPSICTSLLVTYSQETLGEIRVEICKGVQAVALCCIAGRSKGYNYHPSVRITKQSSVCSPRGRGSKGSRSAFPASIPSLHLPTTPGSPHSLTKDVQNCTAHTRVSIPK